MTHACATNQSVGDADVITVEKALEMAKHHQLTVSSDDRHSCVLASTMKGIAFTVYGICCSPMPEQVALQQSKTKGNLTLFNKSNPFKFKRVYSALGMCSRQLVLWENLD